MYKKYLIYQKQRIEPYNNVIYNNILKELDKNKTNFFQKDNSNTKQYIKFNIIYLKIKIISIKSNNFFIRKINSIFYEKSLYKAYKAFLYLKQNFLYQSKEELYEFYILNALFYELLFDIESSIKYYNKIFKIDNKFSKELHNSFLFRNADELKKINKFKIEDIKSIEQLHSTFNLLSNLYEHYKECNRLDLSKNYFTKSLDVLEVLYNKNSIKYRYLYINKIIYGLQNNLIPKVRVIDANIIISKIDNRQVETFFTSK